MKIEEWENKTDEWKNGYLAYVNSYTVENNEAYLFVKRQLAFMNKDWWLGFDYAYRYAKLDKQNGEYPFIFFAKDGEAK